MLYLDLELLPHEAPERIEKIKEATGFWDTDGFYLQQLRGHVLSLDKVREGIIDFSRLHKIALILLDPYYKLSGGADEIGTEEVARFLSGLEEICRETDAAVGLAHHFTKGDSSQKSVIDLASGSGVFGRDPDLIIGVRELKDSTELEPLVRMEFVARSFKPVSPVGLRWAYPIWKRDDNLDLELKTPGGGERGRPVEYCVADILEVLADKELSVTEWGELCGAKIGVSRRKFMELKAEAKSDVKITERKDGRSVLCKAMCAVNDQSVSASAKPLQMNLSH